MLGGSSNLNYLVYSRGSRHDYDFWAQNGCEGWSYEDVLPYFLKSETNRNKHYAKSGKDSLGNIVSSSKVYYRAIIDNMHWCCFDLL